MEYTAASKYVKAVSCEVRELLLQGLQLCLERCGNCVPVGDATEECETLLDTGITSCFEKIKKKKKKEERTAVAP